MAYTKRHTLFRSIFTMAMLLLSFTCVAANFTFRHYDTSNGLSQNSVLSIMQDHLGFMWFGTRGGLNRFDGRSFKVYHSGRSTRNLGNDHINVLYDGPSHEIWVGTEHGVYIYSTLTDSFRAFNVSTPQGVKVSGNVNVITGNNRYVYIASINHGVFIYDIKHRRLSLMPLQGLPSIFSITVGKHGTIWVGSYHGGLNCTRDNFRTLIPVKQADGSQVLQGQTVTGIVATERNSLYLCTMEHGLSCYDIPSRKSTPCITSFRGKSLYAHALMRAGNELVMSTETALVVYNIGSKETRCYQYEATDPFSLSDVHLQTAYMDRDGGLWVGSYFGGINYSPQMDYAITNYFPRVDIGTSLYGRRVHQIAEDPLGHIWIGTEDGGLGYMQPGTNQFHHVKLGGLSSNVQSLRVIDGKVWVGTFQDGLSVVDPATGAVVKRLTTNSRHTGLNDDNVFTTISLHDGRIAIGTLGGLNIYDPATDKVSAVPNVPKMIIYAVLEDHLHNLWVAVYNDGIYMLPSNGQHWKRFSGKRQQVENTVFLFEDSHGGIWAATDGNGVSRYNRHTLLFTTIPIPRYDPCRVVLSISEDQQGHLWMGTNKGLICYTPNDLATRIFTTSNGLLDNNFSHASALCSRSGKMYFGSQSGLTTFMPEEFIDKSTSHSITATELIINGQMVDNFTKNSPLAQCITMTHELSLNHNQNSFALKIATLYYRNIGSHQVEYMLEGFDKNWQHLYNDNYIRYTNLPAGQYKLIVRDNDNSEGALYTLDITIRSPWWNTWWAWLMYITAGAGGMYFVYLYMTQRSEMLRRIAISKFKYEKEKELYQSKINFFTHVAHEIRTPLTLIKGPLTDIIEHRGYDNETEHNLEVMDKNVSRLLNLSNQLLDFRKTEMNGLKLNLERCNINELIQEVCVRFTPVMKKHNITYSIILPEIPLYAYVDMESMTKIISNLTNNAVKYCNHEVNVRLEGDPAHYAFKVTVSNDGALIPQDMRQKIFKPFFRVESETMTTTTGTGIGLALARALAELHGGSLDMENNKSLNVFVLCVPIGKNPTLNIAADSEPGDTPAEFEQPLTATADTPLQEHKTRHSLLIVEDNPDMRQYEKEHLEKSWAVYTASNGEEALKMLEDHDVDLIVSDAMMEPIDGFELCRKVKENINFSHIPFILLTALTLDSAKIKGMESGADYYIEKPFSTEYLISVIQNLLRARDSVRQAYASSPFIKQETVTISKADEKFTRKLEKAVADNLTNPDFGITELADLLCMSRTNLNRKIKGIFDQTPNNYIKIERLKKAAQLMKEEDVKVNEVCYRVGFNSPSYFTQCFQKQFGLLPKDFIMQR